MQVLEQRISVLEQENHRLKQENAKLRQENLELRQENDLLKERLNLNSSNSSLPPSRDIYRTKRHNRPQSHRHPGAQQGHKPQGYKLQTPDEVIDVLPDHCACGHPLEKTGDYRVDQKIDIPPIKPYVTEYRLYRGICRACGKKKTAALPKGVQPDLLGSHAKAIITALIPFLNQRADIIHDQPTID